MLVRLAQMVPLLLAISVIMFVLLTLAPGSPLDAMIAGNPSVRPEDVARLRHYYGLDDPIPVRYVKWLGRTVRGDLGWSITYHVSVGQLFRERLPNSVLLTATAFVLTLCVAIPIGILSALRPYSLFDYAATSVAFLGFSIPSFWFGLVAIYVFGVYLKWFPAGGFRTTGIAPGWPELADRLWHMVLPTVVLALVSMASVTRYTRSSMLEVVRQDYVRTARAKGLVERTVVVGHMFRNALVPIVTLLALAIPRLFGGAPVTESVFAWPGIGHLLVDAVIGGDYVVAIAVLMFLALLVLCFNLLADVAYALLDPRIRYDVR